MNEKSLFAYFEISILKKLVQQEIAKIDEGKTPMGSLLDKYQQTLEQIDSKLEHYQG